MIKLQFDSDHQVQDFTFVLSLKNHDHLGQIRNVDASSVDVRCNMNSADEFSFTVYKYDQFELAKLKESGMPIEENLEKLKEPLWDEITDLKFVYVKELDEYFEIIVDKNSDENLYKTITGTSACEVELSQSYLYNLEINTELDIARIDYVDPTIFYNPDKPECSLLHRSLYKLPQYHIKHVDESLKKIQRTFSANGTDVYSFLTTTVSEEIGCLFDFDSSDRGISVYDLQTTCADCGYRGEFSDACPKCGSTVLNYYGEDTTILVDGENLAENINLTVDTESIKNCFKLEAGDDDMTAAVVNLNPNGSSYIYYFSEEQKHDMPNELVARMDSYDKLYASYEDEYAQVTADMYEAIDKIIYYTSGMMPTQKDDPTNAALEAAKLTEVEMSPMGMTEVTKNTSTATVNTALKNYAKVFVKSGYFKIDINQGEFNYEGTDANGVNYGYWKGNFKITNYSDEEDIATSELVNIKVCDDFETYMVQKIKKKLALEDDEEGSIFDVLSIEDLDKFKDALTYYGLNRLKSFYDATEGCVDIMIELDQGHENADLYDSLYTPYYQKLKACQQEIDKRQVTIDEWGNKLDIAENRRNEIQKILNFEDYLGAELYKVFCMYKRENTFKNENYISDGLENNEIFERAKQFVEAAKTEIIKAGTYQRVITSTLLNLLCMKEFIPIVDKFVLGNFIRIKIDGEIYRLRLISYAISFNGIQNIDVEFADVTRVRTGVSDMQSIISKAQSMASSYGGIMHQVKESKKETDKTKEWSDTGLSATAVKIVNNSENQDIVFKDSGLLARRKDEFTGVYNDSQLKLLNTGIYITNDSWASVETALGKFYLTDKDGNNIAKFGLNAETIVGQLIIGEKLSLYSNDASKEMYFDDRGLVLNSKNNKGTYQTIFEIQKDGVAQMYIDENGNLMFANPQMIETGASVESMTLTVNNLSQKVDRTEESVNSMNNDVKNIINVLSGNSGASPLVKMQINSSNAKIADGLIVDAMVSNYAAIQSSKIKNGNKTVETVLEEHSANITNLQADVEALQKKDGDIESTVQDALDEIAENITVTNDDGTTSSLMDKYLELLALVESLQAEIEELKSQTV